MWCLQDAGRVFPGADEGGRETVFSESPDDAVLSNDD